MIYLYKLWLCMYTQVTIMNDLAREKVRALPLKRQETKKMPMFEGPRSTTDSKVADWLSRYNLPSRTSELFCRYLNAKAELVERYRAQIGLEGNNISSKPAVTIRVEFPTTDTTINQDLNYLIEKTGFKLTLKREPVKGNGKEKRAYVVVEDRNGSSSDITKAAETMEKLLRLASEWDVQSREAAEMKAMAKDGVWAAYLKVRWNHI